MSDIQHGRRITTEGYYDGKLITTRQEFEVSILTTKDSLLKDVIDSLNVITSGDTHNLTIEICIDSKGRHRIIKKWRDV